jgi:ABC-type transporter Mla subunit MlaD
LNIWLRIVMLPISQGRFKAGIALVTERCAAHRPCILFIAKTEDENNLRGDINSLLSASGGLVDSLNQVTSTVATLRKQIEASDQLLRYILSQVAAVSDDIKLVLSVGQSVFEPEYLPFLRDNEVLMKQHTDDLTAIFHTYFTVLEAPQ